MLSPLAEQALSGENPQLTLLAAQGLLPLPVDELLTLQVRIAAGADAEAAELAVESLKATESRVVTPFLAHEAPEDVLRWFAEHSGARDVIEVVMRRRDVPTDVLLALAPRLSADLQEMLLLRQDRITATPELLTALETNPQITSYAVRRIREYREHLLGGLVEAREEPAAAEEVEDVPDHVVEAAIVAARTAEAPEGEVEEKTGLTEGQMRQLPMPVRLKLARNAPRTLRQFLIRDSSALVAVAVLQSNPISDQEVELYARSRNVCTEVLEFIHRTRQWVSKYPVQLNLAGNPRTPLPIALSMVSRLAVRDLRNMAKDRNLPEAVRSAALRFYKVKSF